MSTQALDPRLPWWAPQFFDALERGAPVSIAVDFLPIARSVVYYHRSTNPAFARRWEAARLAASAVARRQRRK